jgi:RND family efflux transporter MFP subunit
LFVALALPVLASCQKSSNAAPKQKPDDPVAVTVAPVRLLKLDRTIPVVGTLYAKDEATIAAEVEGQVEKTMVEFGDRIQANQLLAQIDTASYQALARQAEANLAKAKANAANAEQSLKRVQDLQQDKIASPSDLDKAVADALQARSEVKAAEAAEAIARLNLERSRVKAPFDAAVAERIANAGDFVKAGAPLFRVVNDDVLKFITQAPEKYAGQVKKEQWVAFTVDAYAGQTFTGKVYLISPQVNTTLRMFPFGALVQNSERKLKANSYARGELLLEHDVPTPVVPLDAVVSFAGITKVFVVENGFARSREVLVGRIQAGRQEVLSGLKEGEIVVTSGQTKLFDGAKVRVKGTERTATS